MSKELPTTDTIASSPSVSSSVTVDGVKPKKTAAEKRRLLIQEVACHITMIIAGWSDASSGPLLPYIQSYYTISYTIVSMLFVGQMVGFLTAGFLNSHLTERFGLGKVIVLGGAVQAIGYTAIIPGSSFVIMPCAYAVIGFGMALQDAASNVFVSTLDNSEHKLGILHASYGFGALICPLVATAFASSGIRFSYFYAISVSLAVVNVLVLLYAFKFSYRVEYHDQLLVEGDLPKEDLVGGEEKSKDVVEVGMVVDDKKKENILILTLKNKAMWLCSLFIFVYVGAEVTIGGWIVTFMRDSRGGSDSAGYIASGFWLGITIGRAALPTLNVWVGEKRIVPYYIAAGIILQLIIYFVRNLIADAVMVGLTGITMGPLYPITISIAIKLFPSNIIASGVGFIAAFGQTGSALFPFLTGVLTQKYSTAVLQPVMITLFGIMFIIWYWVPEEEKKND